MHTVSRNDIRAGAIFIAFGGYFVLEALTYELGTPFRMGPGFMPVLLGAILVALGLAVAVNGYRRSQPDEIRPIPWRALAMVLGGIIFFAATVRGLGFVPVVFVTALGSALGSKLNTMLFAVVLAVGLTILCTAVFVYGLGAVIPLFGPWLRF